MNWIRSLLGKRTRNTGFATTGTRRPRIRRIKPGALLALSISTVAWLTAVCGGLAQTPSYTHYEARHTHSIALTPDGTHLLALNTSDARLSVFNVSSTANAEPVLVAEIPVGLEPVAVRARTNDEAWVVSELGDTVAVVSLSQRAIIDTLQTSDEPADVVFAQGKAFVTCARNGIVRVFDAQTRASLGTIPLTGNYPRALATDPAGTKVYAAFLLSGNNTTVIPGSKVLSSEKMQHTDPLVPLPPNTGLIVPASDSRVNYTVLDRDVAEIDAISQTVTRYLSGAGTNLFDVAVHPQTGDLWVGNTHARNLTRFEHDLRGRFVDHRITKLAAADGAATVYDTNPGFNYFAPMPYAFGRNNSIAHPAALAFTADGTHVWVAGFNSDRLGKFSTTTGALVTRVDVRPTGVGSRGMRGPRAMVLHPTTNRLYVLNKLSNTISVISTASDTVLTEIPTGTADPMPVAIKEGRGFLFDARISGRGIGSCASCHLDGDLDGLAWDLGDRSGAVIVVQGRNLSAHDLTLRDRGMHPMKGPMVTQTLRGMQNGAPFHWRGDKPTIQSFNPTFDKLMGGAQIPAADMDALTAYLLTLLHHPNPNVQRDGSLPATFNGGDVLRGKALFEDHVASHCITCHALPPGVTKGPGLPNLPDPTNNIDLMTEIGAVQPVKNPSLATVYQRMKFNPVAGQTSISGFGLLHDGTGFGLPTVHPYVLDQFESPADFADVTAFVLCFSTGTPPTLGASRTVTPANTGEPAVVSEINLLESQAIASKIDLVVRGTSGGSARVYRFDKTTQTYVPDTAGHAPITRSALLASLAGSDAFTFLGAPTGYGARFSTDRNSNGVPDADEPRPPLQIGRPAEGTLRLLWPNPLQDWSLQFASTLSGPWQPVLRSAVKSGASQWLDETPGPQPMGFYRLRRTW
jgi:YVTN family beta-propeller protein